MDNDRKKVKVNVLELDAKLVPNVAYIDLPLVYSGNQIPGFVEMLLLRRHSGDDPQNPNILMSLDTARKLHEQLGKAIDEADIGKP